ncbi:MAG: orotate phosphoribosyltransferase [Candidatus Sumerlaeaceae bacterium]|nr:orotate phosphoribosyltransferase [Candidatus Sumerlaeaceae bacterium]
MVTQYLECVEKAEALATLQKAGAYWSGHFLLSSGLHSPEYFQCARLFEWPALAEQVARAIAEVVRAWQPQVVLAPAIGGILVGYELARQLAARTIFAERPSGTFELRRGFNLQPGERVLLAENVITTGGSVLEVADLARRHGAEIVGFATIVDRSGGAFAPEAPVAAYLRTTTITYSPTECPLCQGGMPVSKPGSRK